MAGDWFPVDVTLPRKAEVLAIARATGRSRHEVVGLLIEFWAWASCETSNGRLMRLTVDDVAHAIGADAAFFSAMMQQRWLRQTASGLLIPNAERWLSKSAKSRLQKNLRQAKWRKGDPEETPEAVDVDVDADAPTREEKRREEKNDVTSRDNSTSKSNGNLVRPAGRTCAKYHPAFEAFWKAYPRRVGKKAAMKAWVLAGKGLRLSDQSLSFEAACAKMQTACEAFAASPLGKSQSQFIPHPSSWLNQGRWDDDPATWQERSERADKARAVMPWETSAEGAAT